MWLERPVVVVKGEEGMIEANVGVNGCFRKFRATMAWEDFVEGLMDG